MLAEIHGVNVIQKILASTALDAAEKAPLIENTKRVLVALNVSTSSAYRRILEVCLSTVLALNKDVRLLRCHSHRMSVSLTSLRLRIKAFIARTFVRIPAGSTTTASTLTA